MARYETDSRSGGTLTCISRYFRNMDLLQTRFIGIVTTAGESLSPILEKVAILEAVSDDLVNMLSGEGNFLASYPGKREISGHCR